MRQKVGVRHVTGSGCTFHGDHEHAFRRQIPANGQGVHVFWQHRLVGKFVHDAAVVSDLRGDENRDVALNIYTLRNNHTTAAEVIRNTG